MIEKTKPTAAKNAIKFTISIKFSDIFILTSIKIFSQYPSTIYQPRRLTKKIKQKQIILEKNDLLETINEQEAKWWFFDKGKFRENLYNVPHNSLVIVGTLGHSLVKEVLFGNMAENLQTVLPNNLLLVGPNYIPHF
jgi:hypothetical protein